MKIIIAEDQTLLRKLLVQLCEKDLCFNVLAETSDGLEALELCKTLSPDVLLLDIVMPGLDGLSLAQQILPEKPRLRILGFSAQCNPRTVYQAIECGLHGLLDKSHESWATLKDALHTVANGGVFFSATVKETCQRLAQDPLAFPKILSKREQEMLSFFGKGMSNQTVADQTTLSPKTVQGHRHNIMKKLDINNTPHLMRYALETGFWRPAVDGEKLSCVTHISVKIHLRRTSERRIIAGREKFRSFTASHHCQRVSRQFDRS